MQELRIEEVGDVEVSIVFGEKEELFVKKFDKVTRIMIIKQEEKNK